MISLALAMAAGVAAAVASPAASSPARAAASSDLRVEQLRVELLTNPIGLESAAPRFSWALASARRGAQPSAYQLQVGRDRSAVARGLADLWSPGRIDDASPWLVPYGGEPLRSRQQAYWRVRVWDESGCPSAWSPVASFELGLLSPTEWQASQWIGAPDAWYEKRTAQPSEHLDVPALASPPLLRRRFTLPAAVRRARAYVAAFGLYELHVNGRAASDRVLDPVYTNPDHRVPYVVLEVTPLLRRGENTMGFVLGNGRHHPLGSPPWKAHPRVRAQIEIELADGTQTTIATDDRWTMTPSPLVQDATKDVGETYDARLADPRWATVQADTSQDQPVAILAAPRGPLVAQVQPPIRVLATVRPRVITRPAPGVAVFDFGQNMAGFVRLRVRAPRGTRIELRHAERLDARGRLEYKGVASPDSPGQPPFQRDVYVARGDGEEVWQPRFTYHGFRYVEVTGLPQTPSTRNLDALAVSTDFETIGQVSASDPAVAAFQRAFAWTYRANFVGIPTDCPQREKNGWSGDAHFAIDAGLYNFHNAAAYASWLRELREAQKPAGSLPGMAPTPGFGYEDQWSGPTWDLALYLIPWRLYEHTGDLRAIEDALPAWTRHLEYLRGRRAAGAGPILDHGIGDWLPAHTQTPADVMSTAAYYRSVDLARRAAGALARGQDAQRFAALATEIARAFRDRFAPGGVLALRTQAGLATALDFGLLDDASPALRKAALDALVADVHAKGDHLDTGVNGAKALIRALADRGHAELAYRVITQPTPPSWGAMLAGGATTLWEDWTAAGSLNHVYQGDPSAFFYRTLAGLEPEGPAWARVVVRPNPLPSLAFVDARVRTLRGLVASRWQRTLDGDVTYTITIPPGSRGAIALTSPSEDAISERGRTLRASAPHVRILGAENGRVLVETTSGTYRFRVLGGPRSGRVR